MTELIRGYVAKPEDITNRYLDGATAATFDYVEYLSQFDMDLMQEDSQAGTQYRIMLTKYDPLLFAMVYLGSHLTDEQLDPHVSFSDFHFELCKWARQWARDEYSGDQLRSAWVAPRGCGKSTWTFLILPLWALAHQHRWFIAAFADSGPQAQQHLSTLKQELDYNDILQMDFPDLCTAMTRRSGTTVADRQDLYIAKSGVAFMAKGIDSSTLGAKIGKRRPDILLFDDVEPDESNYSEYQKNKRLSTIINAVFPMNYKAIVCMVGTVQMPGAIFHDLVRTVLEPGSPDLASWVEEEEIRVNYFPAMTEDDSGGIVSVWPTKWPPEWLKGVSHTRSFALNMQNNPLARDGSYWTQEDFTYGEVPFVTRWLLSIDTATGQSKKADSVGLAVVAYSVPEKRCTVFDCYTVKRTPRALRERVLAILEQWEDIKLVLVESNFGGPDHWKDILHDLPVKLQTVQVSGPKEVRAEKLLQRYQEQPPAVTHVSRLSNLEGQMVAFPQGAHDDMIDAVGNGVTYFLGKARPKKKSGVSKVTSYV